MKKFILLPVVLATCGFVLLTTNTPAVETKAETTELSLTIKDVIANVKPNGSTTVNDVNTDLVTYSMRAGNPETGVYNVMTSTHDWNHDFAVDGDNNKDGVEWNGARIHAIPGNYVMIAFETKDDMTIRMHGGQPWGDSQDSYIKYYIANANYAYDQTLVAAHTAYRTADGKWNPDDIEYTATLKAGETLVWAWGGSGPDTWANLQVLEKLTLTFTKISDTHQTASLTPWHLFTDTVNHGGVDSANDLASYGMRFGKPTTENPYSEKATASGAQYITEGGLKHDWWKLFTNKDSGFAFSITAKQRITVAADFVNYDSFYTMYAGKPAVSVHYLIVRNNEIIKTVYTNSELTGSFATDEALLETTSLLELLPGDSLLLGFNANVTPESGDPFNLMLGSYNNLTFTLSTVTLSGDAKVLVNKWMALRANHNNDLCNLTGKEAEKLNDLVARYYKLSAAEQEIVGRTIDVEGYTLLDGIHYFETATASSRPYSLVQLDSNKTVLLISIISGISALAIIAVVLKKKKAK